MIISKAIHRRSLLLVSGLVASVLVLIAIYYSRQLLRQPISAMPQGTVVLLGTRSTPSTTAVTLGSGPWNSGFYGLLPGGSAQLLRSPFYWPPDFFTQNLAELSPDGSMATLATLQNSLSIVNTEYGTTLSRPVFPKEGSKFLGVKWSPDGRSLAVGEVPDSTWSRRQTAVGPLDFSIRVYELDCLLSSESCTSYANIPHSCILWCDQSMSSEGSWLPDSQRLVVWDKDGERLSIASLNGAAVEHFSIDAPGCNSALFSADESVVAISCDDGIYLAHGSNGQGAQRVVENTEPENWVHLVAWENSGPRLLFIGSWTMLETASRGWASDESIWNALFYFDVSTGRATRLTDSAHEILGAAWVISK